MDELNSVLLFIYLLLIIILSIFSGYTSTIISPKIRLTLPSVFRVCRRFLLYYGQNFELQISYIQTVHYTFPFPSYKNYPSLSLWSFKPFSLSYSLYTLWVPSNSMSNLIVTPKPLSTLASRLVSGLVTLEFCIESRPIWYLITPLVPILSKTVDNR